jgi:hypothetical protein
MRDAGGAKLRSPLTTAIAQFLAWKPDDEATITGVAHLRGETVFSPRYCPMETPRA